MKYRSSKTYDGFSCCFRQWKAVATHCSRLHGYSVYFKVVFVGELDEKNWVFDFGGMKRARTKIDDMNPADWLNGLLDHTVIMAKDDPALPIFVQMDKANIVKLHILPDVGAERFAEYLLDKISDWVSRETYGRVLVESLEFFENPKNSAIAYNRTLVQD